MGCQVATTKEIRRHGSLMLMGSRIIISYLYMHRQTVARR